MCATLCVWAVHSWLLRVFAKRRQKRLCRRQKSIVCADFKADFRIVVVIATFSSESRIVANVLFVCYQRFSFLMFHSFLPNHICPFDSISFLIYHMYLYVCMCVWAMVVCVPFVILSVLAAGAGRRTVKLACWTFARQMTKNNACTLYICIFVIKIKHLSFGYCSQSF